MRGSWTDTQFREWVVVLLNLTAGPCVVTKSWEKSNYQLSIVCEMWLKLWNNNCITESYCQEGSQESEAAVMLVLLSRSLLPLFLISWVILTGILHSPVGKEMTTLTSWTWVTHSCVLRHKCSIHAQYFFLIECTIWAYLRQKENNYRQDRILVTPKKSYIQGTHSILERITHSHTLLLSLQFNRCSLIKRNLGEESDSRFNTKGQVLKRQLEHTLSCCSFQV